MGGGKGARKRGAGESEGCSFQEQALECPSECWAEVWKRVCWGYQHKHQTPNTRIHHVTMHTTHLAAKRWVAS